MRGGAGGMSMEQALAAISAASDADAIRAAILVSEYSRTNRAEGISS